MEAGSLLGMETETDGSTNIGLVLGGGHILLLLQLLLLLRWDIGQGRWNGAAVLVEVPNTIDVGHMVMRGHIWLVWLLLLMVVLLLLVRLLLVWLLLVWLLLVWPLE